MSVRIPLAGLLSAAALLGPVVAPAQSRVIDEGAFVVLKGGAPARTESFKISRADGATITATGSVSGGGQVTTSSLTTDAVGTPAAYELHVRERGAKVVDVKAMARGTRLTSMASSQAGDEAMREFPLAAGKTLIVEPGLIHQLYFVALGKGPGPVQIIEPRSGRSQSGTLTAKGMEPIEVAGRNVTATHYSLAAGAARYEFWVDAQGRLLKVESTADGLSATREELPR